MILVFLMNGQSDSWGDALMLLALVIFCASIESFLSDHFSLKLPTYERHHECLAQLFFMFNSTMNIDLDFPRSSFFSLFYRLTSEAANQFVIKKAAAMVSIPRRRLFASRVL